MPPAATAKVSEKIRLITSPMPTASMMISLAASVCNFLTSARECHKNLFPKTDDISHTDNERPGAGEKRSLFKHFYGGCTGHIGDARGVQAHPERLIGQ